MSTPWVLLGAVGGASCEYLLVSTCEYSVGAPGGPRLRVFASTCEQCWLLVVTCEHLVDALRGFGSMWSFYACEYFVAWVGQCLFAGAFCVGNFTSKFMCVDIQ